MTEPEKTVLEDWEKLKSIIVDSELDATKAAAHNYAAAARVRKALREVKKLSSQLVKRLLEEDRAQRDVKKGEKDSK